MLVILDDDRLWSVGVGTESARPLELASLHLTPAIDEPDEDPDTQATEPAAQES